MSIIFSLLDTSFAPLLPGLYGWIAWGVFVLILLGALYSWRQYQPKTDARFWVVLLGLAGVAVATNLFLGIELPAGEALPLPGVPQEPMRPALMLFAALPWVIAAGVLGPFGGAAVAFVAGITRMVFETQNVFTPLIYVLVSILFSVAVRQRFRTPLFRVLSQPLAAGLATSLLFPFVFVISLVLTVSGDVAVRLDYAMTSVLGFWAAFSVELLLASVFAQILMWVSPQAWGQSSPLQPSPAERSLQARFMTGMGALIIFLLGSLLVGAWYVAGNAARQMVYERLNSVADMVAQSVPVFLDTGQNLINRLAEDPALLNTPPEGLTPLLTRQIRSIPYFDQLMVFDSQSNLIGVYPSAAQSATDLFPEEKAGLRLALSGIASQTFTIPAEQINGSARISFIAAVTDANNATRRVLVGRTSLASNPFTQPFIYSLNALSENQVPGQLSGFGLLLDEKGRVVYHPTPALVMSEYLGTVPENREAEAFFEDTGLDGTRSIVFYQPIIERSWAVILLVPAQNAQRLELTLVTPLALMIFVLALVALIFLRFGLQVITTSLQNLTSEAVRIAQGQLDRPLSIEGVDEVGQLRRSFEQMRVSLQSRLEELNRLLLVSQGVASTLDMEDAVQPVLEAVLATGASAVRVIINPADAAADEQQTPFRFALGAAKEQYAYLDDSVGNLIQQQEKLILTSLNRVRGLNALPGQPLPASMLGVALRHENRLYGVLWAAYDQPRVFSESDVRFLTTVAGQAALAAANTHLFLNAEIGRQRLAAILASTPDPVLVTDYQNCLLLANPAAAHVLGGAVAQGTGQPIAQIVAQQSLLDILQSTVPDKQSAEVYLDNQIYLATASPVVIDERLVGRVCILRDVTHFKELDLMKSEFVNTVSHDLRSPLTLIRGYATMLEMVGETNDQQRTYVGKIVTGVENMTRLVNNLLDLGRIEAGVGLQLETISAAAIVERATSPLELQASQKQINLRVEMAPNPPMMEADPTLLQQAMYNLTENAIKYTPPQGSVTVRVTFTNALLQFSVQDTGIGISAEDQTRLFEKFYRSAEREARQQKGTGLGLAIVRSIAEQHGGRVWLKSALHKGSTFFMEVPLRQSKSA
jgi:signal transduction histidine kinase/HAMP domain-containing protein